MNEDKTSFSMRMLSKFSYTQKFIFISLLYLFAILVVGYFMIQAQNFTINSGKQELLGNEYQRAIRKVFQPLNMRYVLLSTSSAEKGDPKVEAQLKNLDSKIYAGFDGLIFTDNSLETELKTTGSDFHTQNLENIKPVHLLDLWKELDSKTSTLNRDQLEESHNDLISKLKGLIVHIGDTSNLILDPDIDTYYLMDSSLIRMPDQQTLFPQLIIQAENAARQKVISEKSKAELVNLISLLASSVLGSKEGIQKANLEDRNNKGDNETQEKLEGPLNLYVKKSDEFIKYIKMNLLDAKESNINQDKLVQMGEEVLNANYQLWDEVIVQEDRLLNTRIQKFRLQQLYSILISLAAIVIGFSFGLFLMRQISLPIDQLLIATKELAQGNLSKRVTVFYEDEIGQVSKGFNRMAETFQGVIGQLQKSGILLTKSTAQIVDSAKEQESISIEQETATKEIEATVKQISITSRDFAKTMDKVSKGAEETSRTALFSKDSLAELEEVMKKMVDSMQDIVSKLGVINDKAAIITNIITTITKVSDQTNLLSLNAAIEAEKAGEHGRSFSVIAREIRRLSEQTAHATLDIEKMVNEMIKAVSEGVLGMDQFQEDILSGVKKASNIGEKIAGIIEMVQVQTDQFDRVNKGMQNQSSAAEQIRDAIVHLTKSARLLTESIQQFHTSASDLSMATKGLEESVNRLQNT